jgi:acyl-CoA synthetase (AMP-forming)/AMP-acid ligase II
MYPTYGLAEHTVYVCDRGSQRLSVDAKALDSDGRVVLVEAQGAALAEGRGDGGGGGDGAGGGGGDGGGAGGKVKSIVGCGYPGRSGSRVDVQIVDPETSEARPEDAVGEIWIDSPSKVGW